MESSTSTWLALNRYIGATILYWNKHFSFLFLHITSFCTNIVAHRLKCKLEVADLKKKPEMTKYPTQAKYPSTENHNWEQTWKNYIERCCSLAGIYVLGKRMIVRYKDWTSFTNTLSRKETSTRKSKQLPDQKAEYLLRFVQQNVGYVLPVCCCQDSVVCCGLPGRRHRSVVAGNSNRLNKPIRRAGSCLGSQLDTMEAVMERERERARAAIYSG